MINFGSAEFKVGLLVVVIAALIGGMSLKVAEGPGFMAGNKSFWFDLEDAGGLVPNSGVRMAGIKVGVVESIELVNGKARVFLEMESDVPIKTSSAIEIRSDGILGDKHVEILPGRLEDPLLKEGEPIQLSGAAAGLDDLMQKLGTVADNLNKATKGEGDPSTPLGRIILNIEKLTKDLSDISGQNKQKINEIVTRVHNITGSLDRFLDEQNPEGFKPAWDTLSRSLERLDRSLKNTEEITQKINDGEGTIGRLINDEETVESLNTAITNVNEFLGGATDLQIDLDYHSEYLFDSEETQTFIGIKIIPGLDRFYYIGIVDDPEGVSDVRDITLDPNGPQDVPQQRVTTVYKNKLKFTALFGKNFYNFTVKGGLFESEGGIGVDYHLLNRDLRFSVEAFDFEDTNVRAFARYNFFKGLYLVAGGDKITDSDFASFFVGGGLFLTNDDLKLLIAQFGR